MIRILLSLSILATVFVVPKAEAASIATCTGKVRGNTLYFYAKGSLIRKSDGDGYVKINNRVVARFDGDSARINYLSKSFSIRNDRGDFVSGKVNSFATGASTLTRMELPGEGIRLVNVPVNCSVK
ncbi:MAG: hypothetical protein V4598_02740 [Bdellovibrionota bacterium]